MSAKDEKSTTAAETKESPSKNEDKKKAEPAKAAAKPAIGAKKPPPKKPVQVKKPAAPAKKITITPGKAGKFPAAEATDSKHIKPESDSEEPEPEEDKGEDEEEKEAKTKRELTNIKKKKVMCTYIGCRGVQCSRFPNNVTAHGRCGAHLRSESYRKCTIENCDQWARGSPYMCSKCKHKTHVEAEKERRVELTTQGIEYLLALDGVSLEDKKFLLAFFLSRTQMEGIEWPSED